jgi:hypothetical protein
MVLVEHETEVSEYKGQNDLNEELRDVLGDAFEACRQIFRKISVARRLRRRA